MVTLSPTATRTEVTVPLTAKLRSASCAGSIVPVVETLWLTVDVATVTVVVVEVAARGLAAGGRPGRAPAGTDQDHDRDQDRPIGACPSGPAFALALPSLTSRSGPNSPVTFRESADVR